VIFTKPFAECPTACHGEITFRSIGFVGKLLGEALEGVAPGPVEAIVAVTVFRRRII
jgi:ABC-type phosphate/phosphonate transport system permease subunit